MYNSLVIYDINNPQHRYVKYHLKCAISNIQCNHNTLFIEWPHSIKSYKIDCQLQIYDENILRTNGKLLFANQNIVIISKISSLKIYNCDLKYLGKIELPGIITIIYDKKYMAYNTVGQAFDLDVAKFTAVLKPTCNVSYAIL